MSFEVVAVGVVASVDVSAAVVAVVVAVTGVSTTVIIAVGCIASSLPVVQLGSTFRVVILVCMMKTAPLHGSVSTVGLSLRTTFLHGVTRFAAPKAFSPKF